MWVTFWLGRSVQAVYPSQEGYNREAEESVVSVNDRPEHLGVFAGDYVGMDGCEALSKPSSRDAEAGRRVSARLESRLVASTRSSTGG